MPLANLKDQVRDFWDAAACGESYATGDDLRARLDAQSRTRYQLEPYIRDFARFADAGRADVLEIGVGMGADHLEWAKAGPKSLSGVDLTPRAVQFTGERLKLYGLSSDVRVADAENLPFPNDSFDIVYSWGVLHHSPDTPKAIREVYRVLRPGGSARIMIYHKYSLVGYMLWIKYGLLKGRPGRSLSDIYAHHLESPGTKAYTVEEARCMCSDFSEVNIRTMLSFADLLEGEVGARHRSILLRVAQALWPRWFFRLVFRNHGILLLIDVTR